MLLHRRPDIEDQSTRYNTEGTTLDTNELPEEKEMRRRQDTVGNLSTTRESLKQTSTLIYNSSSNGSVANSVNKQDKMICKRRNQIKLPIF